MKKSNPAKFILPRPVVLIGMPGAGKSSIGRALARELAADFFDADREIEEAAGRMSVADIFAKFGEAEFRKRERAVIARLLAENRACVLSLGGGAFMNAETRARIRESAFSVWLKVAEDILLKRVKRRTNRPLLQGGDVEEKMAALLKDRAPVYAEADLIVECDERPAKENARRVRESIQAALAPRIR